jgi:hypothetical protein
MDLLLFILAAFCFLHVYRDYLQIKNGYKTWFTRIGHIWHAPQYEKQGMAVFFLAGCLFTYLAFHAA